MRTNIHFALLAITMLVWTLGVNKTALADTVSRPMTALEMASARGGVPPVGCVLLGAPICAATVPTTTCVTGGPTNTNPCRAGVYIQMQQSPRLPETCGPNTSWLFTYHCTSWTTNCASWYARNCAFDPASGTCVAIGVWGPLITAGTVTDAQDDGC